MIPSPSVNSLQLGPLKVHLYGFIIALAITFCYILALKIAKRKNITNDEIDRYFFIVIPSALVFARLYHVFTNFSFYTNNPLLILAIWNGGLGILGAIGGGLLIMYLISKKTKRNFFEITDFFAPLMLLGQAIGRWGNYVNQELYGQPTELPWAVKIDLPNRLSSVKNFETFHPTFLYESLLCFIAFISLYILGKKNTVKTGTLSALYLICYGIIRYIVELFKLDPDTDSKIGLLRVPQYISIVLIIAGIVILIRSNKQSTGKS
ncbi:MAG: prolipoprotein diacylglyceryl transferase [bacterium]|nr:prolipoprotein diacylglyceryl transferase [bacterium]